MKLAGKRKSFLRFFINIFLLIIIANFVFLFYQGISNFGREEEFFKLGIDFPEGTEIEIYEKLDLSGISLSEDHNHFLNLELEQKFIIIEVIRKEWVKGLIKGGYFPALFYKKSKAGVWLCAKIPLSKGRSEVFAEKIDFRKWSVSSVNSKGGKVS